MDAIPDIPAVYIDDGQEYSGWLNLNKFLADENSMEHWQVLYCLLWHQQFTYQGAEFTCPKPQLLRSWLQRWMESPVGKKLIRHYLQQTPLAGLHPMLPPDANQLADYWS
jgi:hypothetical protein